MLNALNLKSPFDRGLRRSLAVAALALASGATLNAAVVLSPTMPSGGSGVPNGDSAGFQSDQTLGYETSVATINSPVSSTQVTGPGYTYDLEFYVQTQIFEDTHNNNSLDFVYQVHNVSVNNGIDIFGDVINRLTLQSFAGYNTTSDYIPSTGASPTTTDVNPVSIDRSAAPGSVMGFTFDYTDPNTGLDTTNLVPSSFSDYLVIRTNATSYVDGTASVLGGLGISGQAQVPFGGLVSVPEPASVSLLAAGALCLGRRRRAGR